MCIAKLHSYLIVGTDCRQALSYLRQNGECANMPHPDLMLLDLNLPCLNSFELLKAIKEDETLRRRPVILLTTSRVEQHVIYSDN
jgi:two-component system, chemotaxis family, response regulator Rcp1